MAKGDRQIEAGSFLPDIGRGEQKTAATEHTGSAPPGDLNAGTAKLLGRYPLSGTKIPGL
jgi:hypothetical protein